MELKYCKKCVMPNTRPKLVFDENGVCSACNFAEHKKQIDWKEREAQLGRIFDKFRRKSEEIKWDCIVPVSGGKDSTYQVYVAKFIYKMNPLAVTFRTDARTEIGEHNLQCLRDMGVDHLDFTPNSKGFAKLRLKTFEEVGDCSLPDHLAIWGVIPNVAVKYRIPLVVWGENPDMEYGAPKDEWDVPKFNRQWMAKQPILKGKRVQDWAGGGISLEELGSMIYPSEDELDSINYTPIFLGYYLPWDAQRNLEVAKRFGFKVQEDPKRIQGLYDYADVDCMYIILHHYFEWFKFGWCIATRDCSNEIRKGRMTRKQAIEIVKKKDGEIPPKEYILHFCKRTGITEKHFWEIAEKFRNRDVWYKDSESKWQLRGWIGGPNIPEKWRHPFE